MQKFYQITDDNYKIATLAKYLHIPFEEAEQRFTDGDYSVYTEAERNDAARDYILDNLWAFKYSFLASFSKAIAQIPEKDFDYIRGKLCESFNPVVRAMIDNLDAFVDEAIKSDGYGHFLSGYDGKQNRMNDLFIYRN